MDIKSPISILQEYTMQKYHCYPTYKSMGEMQPGSVMKFRTECSMNIGQIVVTSEIASNKAESKKLAAQSMITKLGIPLGPIVPNIPAPIGFAASGENFVGMLNEHCSKHMQPYPVYEDSVTNTNMFCITCKHLNLVAMGTGTNKKTAKQMSAKEMLKLLMQNKLDVKPVVPAMLPEIMAGLSSLHMKCEPKSPFKTNTSIVDMAHFINIHAVDFDAVSALNLHAQRKHTTTAPQYHSCGRVSGLYRHKCLYERRATMGTGCTDKLAKQDSAKKMIENLRDGSSSSASTPATPQEDLIDLSPSLPLTPSVSSEATTETLDDVDPSAASQPSQSHLDEQTSAVIDRYKDLSKLHELNNIQAPAMLPAALIKSEEPEIRHFDEFDNGRPYVHLFTELHKRLWEKQVDYKIDVLSVENPAIAVLTLREQNSERKTFMETDDDSINVTIERLLQRAVESLDNSSETLNTL